MKKVTAVFLVLLAALLLSGCATTSDVGESETEPQPLSWNDAASKTAEPSQEPVPYSEQPPKSPKPTKKISLDALFDETTGWPVNAASLPVPMQPAEDTALWNDFVSLFSMGTPLDEQEQYLLFWYGKYGWTPEFYAACHNYYFQKASVLLDTAVSEEDINEVYACLDRCFAACFHGSMQYPDRLDLWCGYVHASNMLGNYENAIDCCLTILNRLDYNNNVWYWTNNRLFTTPEESEYEFVSIMHDYISELYNADQLEFGWELADQLNVRFPDNPVVLNDVALYFLFTGSYEVARPYLEKALEADPSDLTVLNNLAYVCEDLEDYEASLKYANMLIMSGDEDYVDVGIRLCAEVNRLMYPDK